MAVDRYLRKRHHLERALRVRTLKLGLFVSRAIVERVKATNEWIRTTVLRKIDEINSLTVAYFTKGDDVALLNRAALYVFPTTMTRAFVMGFHTGRLSESRTK